MIIPNIWCSIILNQCLGFWNCSADFTRMSLRWWQVWRLDASTFIQATILSTDYQVRMILPWYHILSRLHHHFWWITIFWESAYTLGCQWAGDCQGAKQAGDAIKPTLGHLENFVSKSGYPPAGKCNFNILNGEYGGFLKWWYPKMEGS